MLKENEISQEKWSANTAKINQWFSEHSAPLPLTISLLGHQPNACMQWTRMTFVNSVTAKLNFQLCGYSTTTQNQYWPEYMHAHLQQLSWRHNTVKKTDKIAVSFAYLQNDPDFNTSLWQQRVSHAVCWIDKQIPITHKQQFIFWQYLHTPVHHNTSQYTLHG